MNTSRISNFPWWRFLLPFGLQLGIILLVPAKSAYTYNFGKQAVVQTMPVDPYDLLRGYSQTLSYDISRTSDLKQFFGGDDLAEGEIFYLILEPNIAEVKLSPSPSKIIRVAKNLPQDLSANQVALKGKVKQYGQVSYGLETYYMPESQRKKINQEIRELERDSQGKRPFVVEIKVDRWGNSVPVSLWIGKKNYKF